MRTEIDFKCPKCGSKKIEEIMVGITVATEIYSIALMDDGHVDYMQGDQINEDGHVDRYQCGVCGFTIVDHDSPHSDDGLDEGALVKAIEALNAAVPLVVKGDLVGHGDLVHRIADAYEALSGEELANLWNELFPATPVIYEGDSLYWVEK